MTQKLMSAEDALTIITDLDKLGVKTILDGGWGIDALLGEETREHRDLDLLVEKKNVDLLIKYLDGNGFKQTDNFNKWWHKSFENDNHIIDIHVIEIGAGGNAIYGPKVRKGFPRPGIFPAYALSGSGMINGIRVNCLSPEYRVRSQTRELLDLMPDNYSHSPSKKDYDDLAKICRKYEIEMPDELKYLGP